MWRTEPKIVNQVRALRAEQKWDIRKQDTVNAEMAAKLEEVQRQLEEARSRVRELEPVGGCDAMPSLAALAAQNDIEKWGRGFVCNLPLSSPPPPSPPPPSLPPPTPLILFLDIFSIYADVFSLHSSHVSFQAETAFDCWAGW
jgi:hypothetical protein